MLPSIVLLRHHLDCQMCIFSQCSITVLHIDCSVRFAASNSMEVASSAQGGTVAHGLTQGKRNPVFIKKAPQGEWQALIRATSNLQPLITGGLLPLQVIVNSACG